MATSYFKNIHHYEHENRSFFLHDLLLNHCSNIWYYKLLLSYGKLKKSREKIKTNKEQYTLKITKSLKADSRLGRPNNF